MEERFIEIRFYYYIRRLLYQFKFSVYILDLLEAYCLLGDIDSGVIKQLLKQVRENTGAVVTYKEETIYVARQLGISYNELERISNISRATQYRLGQTINKDLYRGIEKHLSNREYNELYKFMKLVEGLKEI